MALNRLELTTDWLDSALSGGMNAKFEHVFVYGTLMEGMSRHSEMQDGCTLCVRRPFKVNSTTFLIIQD